MERLDRKHLHITKIPEAKILQFGGGNFLRAFVDWMVDILNKEADFNGSVIVIKPTSHGDYDDLKTQDGLFNVVLEGFDKGTLVKDVKLITCIGKSIHPYNEWQEYLKSSHINSLRFIVSNTTESGIQFNKADVFNDESPQEFPAKLTQWLYERFLYFKGASDKGCIILPCELIENNGAILRQTILSYITHWNLEEAFKQWILKDTIFCDTLVDRIVSGYPKNAANELNKEFGYEDRLIVAGEVYHSWIIKAPEIVAEELSFSKTELNVKFVDDLAPYRNLKVRLLNGAHTAMVPVGLLIGISTVGNAMADKEVFTFVETALRREIAPTIKNIKTEEINTYISEVLNRFKNPSIQHYLKDISLNSTAKFQTRILPSLEDFIKKEGKLPSRLVFSLAALLRLYSGHYQDQVFELKDTHETLDFFKKQWEHYEKNPVNLKDLVTSLLENKAVFGDQLIQIPGLIDETTFWLEKIQNQPIRKTLNEVLQTGHL